MSAAHVLKTARAAGVSISLDGDDLVLTAPAPPPPDVIGELARHKTAIIALLRPGAGGWTAEDWQAYFEERASIGEFDGGLSRARAREEAFASCVTEWLNRNPVRSVPGRCQFCGGTEDRGDALLRSGTATAGHVWLHPACRSIWHRERRSQAVKSLSALGVVLAPESPGSFGEGGTE
jgi:hypothetical protein